MRKTLKLQSINFFFIIKALKCKTLEECWVSLTEVKKKTGTPPWSHFTVTHFVAIECMRDELTADFSPTQTFSVTAVSWWLCLPCIWQRSDVTAFIRGLGLLSGFHSSLRHHRLFLPVGVEGCWWCVGGGLSIVDLPSNYNFSLFKHNRLWHPITVGC